MSFDSCYRDKVYRKAGEKYLLSVIAGSDQEIGLTLPPNCNGIGRIRHFNRKFYDDWTSDPLPMDPACVALNLPKTNVMKSQVFQIASCNLNCWYCFVPDVLKQANVNKSKWLTTDEMIQLYIKESYQSKVIVLSGGNPDLVPEWVVNMMQSIERFNLNEMVYLWSDDTVTSERAFEFLSSDQIGCFTNYKNYGKVACFKGYDDCSFEFNTAMPKKYFNKQFDVFKRYLDLGIDMYGYINFTSLDDNASRVAEKIAKIMDRFQAIHKMLPLRIVPQKIFVFPTVVSKITSKYESSLVNQHLALYMWNKELCNRFTDEQRNLNIAHIKTN